MRIHFSNVNFNSQSGPNSFGHRLAVELKKRGHEIVQWNEMHDIYLAFIEGVTPPAPGARTILRLDGIWFKPEEFHTHNRNIRNCYYSFDHVVFQSDFDRRMVEHHFGERADCSVIRNGIEPKHLTVENVYQDDPNVMRFVCAASWHPQKRLTDNVRLFQHIRKQLREQGKEARLDILGKGGELELTHLRDSDHEEVYYHGQKNHDYCLVMYARADYMIHLGWLDHCPNVVVEALSQGCPVICTDSGGTAELVGDQGIVIPETTQYKLELLDYDKPYALDWTGFTLPDERPRVDPSSVHISHSADEYERIFNAYSR